MPPDLTLPSNEEPLRVGAGGIRGKIRLQFHYNYLLKLISPKFLRLSCLFWDRF